jgi:hypothetical protein
LPRSSDPQRVPEMTASDAVDARLCAIGSGGSTDAPEPLIDADDVIIPIFIPTPIPKPRADEEAKRLACDEATARRAAE